MRNNKGSIIWGFCVWKNGSARAVRAGARVLCRLYKENVVTIKDNRGRTSTKSVEAQKGATCLGEEGIGPVHWGTHAHAYSWAPVLRKVRRGGWEWEDHSELWHPHGSIFFSCYHNWSRFHSSFFSLGFRHFLGHRSTILSREILYSQSRKGNQKGPTFIARPSVFRGLQP